MLNVNVPNDMIETQTQTYIMASTVCGYTHLVCLCALLALQLPP